MTESIWFSSRVISTHCMPKFLEERLSSEERVIYEAVICLYSDDPRAYHTAEHIDTFLALFLRFYPVYTRSLMMMSKNEEDKLRRKLFLAILFHDCVYVPGSETNEEDSAEKAETMIPCLDQDLSKEDIKDVCKWILSTKFDPKKPFENLKSTHEEFLHDLDWSGLITKEQLLIDEEKIFHEARQAGYLLIEAQTGRMQFYKTLMDFGKPLFRSVLSEYSIRAKINIEKRFVEYDRTCI